MSSGVVLVGSAGSILDELVTSAIDSSGEMATLCGGACQFPGVGISAMTFGGDTPMIDDRRRIGLRVAHDGVDAVQVDGLVVVRRDGDLRPAGDGERGDESACGDECPDLRSNLFQLHGDDVHFASGQLSVWARLRWLNTISPGSDY